MLLLDRAGWHTTGNLDVPKNISPIFLPSRAPELNPVENIWQFLRGNWLSNLVFETYDDIIDAPCDAWTPPATPGANSSPSPETITSNISAIFPVGGGLLGAHASIGVVFLAVSLNATSADRRGRRGDGGAFVSAGLRNLRKLSVLLV